VPPPRTQNPTAFAALGGSGHPLNSLHLGIHGFVGVSNSNMVPLFGTIYYFPFVVTRAITVTALKVSVLSLGDVDVRVGVYAADDLWQPGALQVDGGVLDASLATGVKSAAVSTALAAGKYLLALQTGDDPGGGSMASLATARGSPATGTPYDSASLSFSQLWRKTRAWAALNTPGTAWDTKSTATTPMPCPVYLAWS
jgi:hypothetical protein